MKVSPTSITIFSSVEKNHAAHFTQNLASIFVIIAFRDYNATPCGNFATKKRSYCREMRTTTDDETINGLFELQKGELLLNVPSRYSRSERTGRKHRIS